MKQFDINVLTKEQLIEILNGASNLQIQLSWMCHVLAEDIELANSGASEGFRLLSGNKDDKIFERLMTMVKMKTELGSLSLLPKPDEKERSSGNVFEDMSKKVQSKINGSK